VTDAAAAATIEAEPVPFVENEREIAYRSEATSQVAQGPAGRPAVVAPAGATGRRKEAVARVRIMPGSGQWNINGRKLDDYFPNKLHQQLVAEPFTAAAVSGSYDVIARIHGGGVTGQADSEASRPALKKAGMLTRDARVKERKKAGLKKARKAPQYSKR
jgi:small subunit ribosomal protein S9